LQTAFSLNDVDDKSVQHMKCYEMEFLTHCSSRT